MKKSILVLIILAFCSSAFAKIFIQDEIAFISAEVDTLDSNSSFASTSYSELDTMFVLDINYEFYDADFYKLFIGGNIGTFGFVQFVGASFGANMNLFKTELYNWDLQIDGTYSLALEEDMDAFRLGASIIGIHPSEQGFYFHLGTELVFINQTIYSEEYSGYLLNSHLISYLKFGLGYKF